MRKVGPMKNDERERDSNWWIPYLSPLSIEPPWMEQIWIEIEEKFKGDK